MFIRLIHFFCFFTLLITHSAFSENVCILEGEEFPPPRSKPVEIKRVYECNKPRLCHFVIPTGVAAIGLAMGAYKATENRDDCIPTPSTPVTPTDVLSFFVEGDFGSGNEGNGGGFTVEIEFPGMSLLDTITLSLPTGIGSLSELSNSTTNFSSGNQFTANVTNVTSSADSITVTMRINGIDILAQATSNPTTSTSFVFTIP